jgi:hypothetical protein
MNTVSKTARKEIVAALRARYEKASKFEEGLILGEFTAVSGERNGRSADRGGGVDAAPERD